MNKQEEKIQMENYSEYMGKAIRLLMINHRKSKLTNKKELSEFLCVKAAVIPHIIKMAMEFVCVFNLKIVEADTHGHSGEYFLVADGQPREDKEIELFKKQLYTVFGCIQATGNNFTNTMILKDCNLFRGYDVNEEMMKMKQFGYISKKITKTEIIWSYGWRFYLEYGHFYDVISHFECKK
ncbi:hypothetical protein EHP00_1880 [Ecytonucleospora hepatopenaei]|uniref:MAGE domain-containing protein n=1 Tax=Ecytonucleospora hepatopenaei TaxID=646526 RepID=A0A1W0E564_9MICR|nr:hypothetical protein EHP00_1880 [Ecytonucleospora hepatopenaei]